jgi:hypothetical protein
MKFLSGIRAAADRRGIAIQEVKSPSHGRETLAGKNWPGNAEVGIPDAGAARCRKGNLRGR